MFYSRDYHRATELAGEILLSNGIDAYPINPLRLANQGGVKVVTYAVFSSLSSVSEQALLAVSGDGFSTGLAGQYLIAYNPAVRPRNRRRWTLLHEYCHIRLGHVPADGALVPDYSSKRYLEAEADELTSCLIAPLPVAYLCGVDSAEEFARCFGLSGQAAANAFESYKRYLAMDVPPELGYGAALDRFSRFALAYRRRRDLARRREHYRNVDVY